MSSHDLDRVRADLSTMRSALGIGSPWGEADVWFGAAISAAGGVYAVLSWPNSPWLVDASWASAPLIAALGAYCIYIALKSRSLPPREEPRRREYKSSLLALALVIPATLVLAKWGKYAGMTPMQLGGCLLAFMGMAFVVIGVVQPPARYPRHYFVVGGIPLIVFGLAIPLLPPPYCHSLIGLNGLVAMGLYAFIAHRRLRQTRMESGNDVGN